MVNPCETLPHTDRQDPGADAMPADDIPTILAEAFAGVPEALVSRYLAARGAFLNRVVQADLSFWDPEALAIKPAAGGKGVPAAGDSAPVPVQTRLFRMVSDVTGFPLASLSRESRLLDDLNLDSIKAGDLIAQFARRCGVTFPDPALLANAALGELTEAAQRLRGDADIPADHPAVDHKELGRRLLARVSEITGFPTASIDLSMRLLDDLNLDSIKAGDLIAHLTTEAGVSGRVDVQSLANASLADVVDRIAAGMGTASAKPVDALVELMRQAGRLTGFPGESLDPDFQVDEDLHIGPDKLKTLVQRTATAMGIQAHVDMDPLLTRSLRQISVILNRMAAEQHGAGAGSTGAAPALAADQSTLVRNFSMDLVETPYPQFPDTWQLRSENDWQKSRVLILHSEDTADVAAVLGQQFFQRGAYTRVHAFEAEDAAENVRDPDFSHIIAIPAQRRSSGNRPFGAAAPADPYAGQSDNGAAGGQCTATAHHRSLGSVRRRLFRPGWTFCPVGSVWRRGPGCEPSPGKGRPSGSCR